MFGPEIIFLWLWYSNFFKTTLIPTTRKNFLAKNVFGFLDQFNDVFFSPQKSICHTVLCGVFQKTFASFWSFSTTVSSWRVANLFVWLLQEISCLLRLLLWQVLVQNLQAMGSAFTFSWTSLTWLFKEAKWPNLDPQSEHVFSWNASPLHGFSTLCLRWISSHTVYMQKLHFYGLEGEKWVVS